MTPLAYTAASPEKGLGKPLVAYHYLNGGGVLGNFHNISVTEGAFRRVEFGFTRALHSLGDNSALSPLWHNGFNIVHGKVNIVPENAFSSDWVPAIAVGVIGRTQVHNVGAALLNKSTSNRDFYIVATKMVTQTKKVPLILNAGFHATNAELWGMGGNAPATVGRSFGALGFVFTGPAKSTIILGMEVAQQPRHPDQLPDAIIPTTLTYCMRVAPLKENQRLNIDFGVAQIAGKIMPGVDLQARARIGAQLSYGF